MESKHTPGPWRWEVNERGRRIQLCGGKRPYDLTVMDFSRWGMQNATPRFLKTNDGMEYLEPAVNYSEPVAGREHHANWFKTVNHPDALLIAAAPDMYDTLLLVKKYLDGLEIYGSVNMARLVNATLATATGNNPVEAIGATPHFSETKNQQ